MAPDHKKLYWSPFTNSLSVSLQMLWLSAIAVGDTIYLLLSKHHGDLWNKFNSNERGPCEIILVDETWDVIDSTVDSQNPTTRGIDLILMNGDPWNMHFVNEINSKDVITFQVVSRSGITHAKCTAAIAVSLQQC